MNSIGQENTTSPPSVINNGEEISEVDCAQLELPVQIRTQGLKKYFGNIKAVDGVNLQIFSGELFSLLGPNGAGKSTFLRMLTTIIAPDSGEVLIAGLDLCSQRNEIRKLIGVCPQEIVISEALNAEENVAFIAKANGYPRNQAKKAAELILTQLGIAGRRDAAKNFSGGMKRRLNLAMALVHSPKIVFLDEPSAGLDPQSRRVVWDYIRNLKNHGITIILTTHDMEEADILSDHVAIFDKGKVIAYGTPSGLKEKYGTGKLLEFQLEDSHEYQNAIELLKGNNYIEKVVEIGNQRLAVFFKAGMKSLEKVQQLILTNFQHIGNMNLRQSSLEDVFLKLTGRGLRD